MILGFVIKLGFTPKLTNVGPQKINNSLLAIYGMVIAGFLFQNSHGKVWFFEKTFLLANISMEVVLKMTFFIFNNANIEFGAEKLI